MNVPNDCLEIDRRLASLVELMLRHTPGNGVFASAIGALHLIRSDTTTDLVHMLHQPGLCVMVQGRKEVRLWDECYTYDPLNYLVVSVTLPLSGQVIEASVEKPYLCLRLDINPSEVAQLIADISPSAVPDGTPGRGLFLDRVDVSLLDAMHRLARLLDTPADIGALAPLALREIHYRLLRGEQGGRLYQMAISDTQTHRVTRAIEWLNHHFAEPLCVDDLARLVNLGTSTFHHRFKAVTAMSPLQYQKQLRLQEARRLLFDEGLDVSSACYRVGYESPSQFSREYSRQFGFAPSRDLARMRSTA